uniref:Uncharacterized protein n=1 Tax=Trichogramma kaykai TaxID=54128 RepID=A0ABD2WY26_9HYME
MMRILQLNLNHCQTAQNLLCDTISRMRIDVAILCEQYEKEPRSTQRMACRCQRSSSYLGARRNPGPGAPGKSSSLLLVGPNWRNFLFQRLRPTKTLWDRIFRPLCEHHRGSPWQEVPRYCRGLQRMVDGVGM